MRRELWHRWHTRRRHPLSQLGLSLPEAIARERELTAPLRRAADAVIDTTTLNVHQLRRKVVTEFALNHGSKLSLLFESFAYKRGVPAEADFVFDVRVLPNPHWDPELRPLSGRDGPDARAGDERSPFADPATAAPQTGPSGVCPHLSGSLV